MRWIVIWVVMSCVPCDSYFQTKGKEPCYEPKRVEHYQCFDDEMAANSFVSVKIADGHEANVYQLWPKEMANGRITMLRKWDIIRALENFARIPDLVAEQIKQVDVEDFVEIEVFIKDLRSGDLELLATDKKSAEKK